MKGSIHQEDIMTLRVYRLNKRTSEYMKQKLMLLKGEIVKSVIQDFNTSSQQIMEFLDRKSESIYKKVSYIYKVYE